jgi:type IV secretion system protein VirD4
MRGQTLDRGSAQLYLFLVMVAILALVFSRWRWRPSRTAFGTARWATASILRRAGMLSGRGLILGRTLGGMLIRLPAYCHILLIGATGSGKGVSIIIPQLLTYRRGSLICFDTKGDLAAVASLPRARMGQRIVRLAPFNGGTDRLNPLDTIPAASPMLVDHARAMAEALVTRQGSEPDPHWNDKAAQVICALLVLVLLRFEGEERSLNSVQEIASDEKLLAAAADKLRELGGMPARLGSQLSALFARED